MQLCSLLRLSLLLSLLHLASGGVLRQADSSKQTSGRVRVGRRLLRADIAAPEVVDANVAHASSIAVGSTISPERWPLPEGYR